MTVPSQRQATSYQRDYILKLLERRPEYGTRFHLRPNLRRLMESVCEEPGVPFRDGDNVESALYSLNSRQASSLIGLLGGHENE